MDAEIYQFLKRFGQTRIYFGLKEPIIKRICDFAKTKEEAKIIAQFIFQILPKDIPLDVAIEIALYNINFFKKFNLHETLSERFQIKKKVESDWWIHPESPFQFNIASKGQRIATFSFYVIPKGDGLEIHVNNLQGSRYSYPTKVRGPPFVKIKHTQDDLKDLNDFLKENWRIYVVKLLQNKFDKENVKIIGDLPKLLTKKGRYKLMIRQYLQAYLKAGIPIDNIDVHNVEDQYFKNWIERNLRIKKERELGLRPEQRNKKRRKSRDSRYKHDLRKPLV